MTVEKDTIEHGLVCDSCGHENAPNVDKCENCGRKKFAPNWVIAKRPINRLTSVEVTLTDAHYGPVEKRITLTKWWPSKELATIKNSSFHIVGPEQWNTIQKIINEDLSSIVGWKTTKQQIQRIKRSIERGKDIDESLRELADQHPELFSRLAIAFNNSTLAKQDIVTILSLIINQAEIMSKSSASFREAYLPVLSKLPLQKRRALEKLEVLLENLSLLQITSIAGTVKARLDTLDLFRNQIRDERTFEITGDNSIHRILERSMWMIDEHYWLLKSNKTLRDFIGDEMSKRDKKRFGNKRPDFVCGSIGDKLIIIELKRPKSWLKIEDLNQLETYLSIAEQYSTQYKHYEAYLIGNKQDDELIKRKKFRSSVFQIWTYSDLVDKTESRYQEFLKDIESG